MPSTGELLKKTYEKAKDFVYVGREVVRIDALEKVLGSAKYFADLYTKDMLVAKVFTSSYPHAKIKSIDSSKAASCQGVECIVTAKDIPGSNNASYFLTDQPLLAEGKVRYEGEPIGVIAGTTEDAVLAALDLIKVDYEPLPPVLDVFEAAENRVLIHETGNVAFEKKIVRGDVSEGFNSSSVIVEDEYRTQWQDHAYIEPEGAVAFPTDAGVKIIGVQQHPHLAQMVVARVLGIERERVEIITPVIGGGFGGKDDVGPWVCAQAALVAQRAGRPTILTYDREQSFLIHPKRFPFFIKYRSGASAEGKLRAIDVKITVDTGAYSNRGPFVLFRGMLTSSGPYEVPNAEVDGKLVYTNHVLGGSFRGFGNPEVHFAAESQMDKLAAKLGMDPVDFRLANMLKPGSLTAFGQRLEEDVGVIEALREVVARSRYKEKRVEYAKYNSRRGRIKKGIGVACVFYGSTITAYRPDGSPRPDWSSVKISVLPDNRVRVDTGIVEIGQGTHTAIAQMVCEALALPSLSYVTIESSSNAPDTWATHSSRGTSYGSSSVFPAAVKLKDRLTDVAADMLGCHKADVVLDRGWAVNCEEPSERLSWDELVKAARGRGVDLSVTETVWHQPRGSFDPKTLTGYIYPSLSYSAFVSEVEVDSENGMVKVTRVWPAMSCGKTINPTGARQQIVGGFVQGVGLTLMEEVKFKDGLLQNPNFVDYMAPRSEESPTFEEPTFIEIPHPYGSLGGKGLGEMGIIVAPASIANAVAHAIGRGVNELPLTPERVHSAIAQSSVHHG